MTRSLPSLRAARDSAVAQEVRAGARHESMAPLGARGSGRKRAAVLTVGVALLMTWGLPGAAPAAEDVTFTLGARAPGAGEAWEESLGLEAAIGDSVDLLARIFDSPDYQRQLMVPGGGEQVYLLGLKDQAVQVLPRAAVAWTADEKAMPHAAQAKAAGSLSKLAGEVTFDTGGLTWTIRPAPPLLGPVTLDGVRKSLPDYVRLAAKYKPDADAVRTIAAARDAHLVVFFGSWCHICKTYVPQFLKTLEAAKNAKLTVEFIGVTEDHDQPAEPIAKYAVSTSPVFIVIRDGKEIGRITEKPDESVEKDLALILAGK